MVLKSAMKKASKEDLQRIAKLAHLQIEEGEMNTRVDEFNQILSYIDQLSDLDTQNASATFDFDPQDPGLPILEDKVVPSIENEKAFENAPEHQENFFTVPKVIGN